MSEAIQIFYYIWQKVRELYFYKIYLDPGVGNIKLGYIWIVASLSYILINNILNLPKNGGHINISNGKRKHNND